MMAWDWHLSTARTLITVTLDLFSFRIGILVDRQGLIIHPLPFVTISTEPRPTVNEDAE